MSNLTTASTGFGQYVVYQSAPRAGLGVIPVAFVTLIVLLTRQYFLNRKPDATGPLVADHLSRKARREKYFNDCPGLLQQGYALLRAGHPFFRLTIADGTEIAFIHPRYLTELRQYTREHMEFDHAVSTFLAGRWASIADTKDPIAISVIKSELTPAVYKFHEIVTHDLDKAFAHYMGSSDEFVAVRVNDFCRDMINRITARFLLGDPHCFEQEWLQLTWNMSVQAFVVAHDLTRWTPWLQIPVAPFLRPVRDLVRTRRRAMQYVMQVAGTMNQEGIRSDQTPKAPADNFLTWLSKRSANKGGDSLHHQADILCRVAVAAIHTTSYTLTQQVMDLAMRPQYIPELREELQSALRRSGGVYTRAALAELRKLDSFMKESARLHPSGFTTFKRFLHKDVRLSDGVTLSKGTFLEFDNLHYYSDPAVVQGADTFDAFRYLKMRQTSSENDRGHQFTTADGHYVNWGGGAHVCPGRFFAGVEAKRVLAKIILEYDLEPGKGWSTGIEADEERPRVARPADEVYGLLIFPNLEAEIRLRRRKMASSESMKRSVNDSPCP